MPPCPCGGKACAFCMATPLQHVVSLLAGGRVQTLNPAAQANAMVVRTQAQARVALPRLLLERLTAFMDEDAVGSAASTGLLPPRGGGNCGDAAGVGGWFGDTEWGRRPAGFGKRGVTQAAEGEGRASKRAPRAVDMRAVAQEAGLPPLLWPRRRLQLEAGVAAAGLFLPLGDDDELSDR